MIVYEPKDPSSDNLLTRLDEVLSEPIRVRVGITVNCRPSIGVADTSTMGYDAAALVAAADAAMYRVKRAHHRDSRRAAPQW